MREKSSRVQGKARPIYRSRLKLFAELGDKCLLEALVSPLTSLYHDFRFGIDTDGHMYGIVDPFCDILDQPMVEKN